MKPLTLRIASLISFTMLWVAVTPAWSSCYCHCEAFSVDGYGWAEYEFCSDAEDVALDECADVTDSNHWCRIDFCKAVRD